MANNMNRQVDSNEVISKLLQLNSELTLQNAIQLCHIERLEKQLEEHQKKYEKTKDKK